MLVLLEFDEGVCAPSNEVSELTGSGGPTTPSTSARPAVRSADAVDSLVLSEALLGTRSADSALNHGWIVARVFRFAQSPAPARNHLQQPALLQQPVHCRADFRG